MAYAWGNGHPGCLFDHTEGPFDTRSDAVVTATDAHDLSADDQAILLRDGVLYQRETETELHTGLIEVFEVDEDWSAES